MFNPIIGLSKQLRYGGVAEMITTRTLVPGIKNFEHMPETMQAFQLNILVVNLQYVTLLVNLLCSLEVVVNFFPCKNDSFIDGWFQ